MCTDIDGTTERLKDIDRVTDPRTVVPVRRHHPLAKPVRRLFLLALVVFLIVVGISVGGALTAPGTDGTAARIAEWARDHNMGDLVTWLERQQYEHNQPKIGGTPTGGIPVAGGAIAGTNTAPPAAVTPGAAALPAPAALTPLAGGTALPGEGQWQTVVLARGQPAVRVASIRPDDQHTSYLAGVIWMDPTLVSGQLRPGTKDPGGTWPEATFLTTTEQRTVAAAFNAGFRLPNNASHGGYYSDGRTAVPLVNGAASLVVRKDGTATVGSWNSEVRMGSGVASVRQNLIMLVDNGQVNPSCGTGGAAEWG